MENTDPTLLGNGVTSSSPESDSKEAETSCPLNLDGGGWEILKFIGFEMEVFSSNRAKGKFVVSKNSCQPFGVLHGGTTAYIAESIASAAAVSAANFERVAGVELNVNHLRAAPVGTEVIVSANPFFLGSRLQVWEVKFEMKNPKKSGSESTANLPELVLVAVGRVTLMVLSSDKGLEDQRKNISEISGLGQLSLK